VISALADWILVNPSHSQQLYKSDNLFHPRTPEGQTTRVGTYLSALHVRLRTLLRRQGGEPLRAQTRQGAHARQGPQAHHWGKARASGRGACAGSDSSGQGFRFRFLVKAQVQVSSNKFWLLNSVSGFTILFSILQERMK